MLDMNLEFALPLPWRDKNFSMRHIGYVNFLVGPNGSGKSKFAQSLKSRLGNARLLGTDRLSGMEQTNTLRGIFGDHLSGGYSKDHFQYYKDAGREGSGIDTLIVLEERMDLRIQVEATLSHLFNRKIFLEWDSGRLLARAVLGATGASYRLDRDECHGIKELLVLLTNLYNDEYPFLIIDEPELNLHPQYQAFFMQEVRKIAGKPTPGTNKKVVFLITHSPFMLDFRSVDDIKSVISFSIDHQVPKQIADVDTERSTRISSLVPRLNVHHKQLFFSDNPIFVEGILDAQLIGTIQESRGVSVAGAGSCIIDAGGCEEVNRYLELCIAFGKKAHFLYDLDSLFSGNLRSCIKGESEVQSFLATAGVGGDLSRYCGELDRKLTQIIDSLLQAVPAGSLSPLMEYLLSLGDRKSWDSKTLARARVALLTAISRSEGEVTSATSTCDVADAKGRLNRIVLALREKNIHLLPGGTIERYLPCYQGSHYDLKDEAKRNAVSGELIELSKEMTEEELRTRYGELFDAVCLLPSKLSVDVDRVIKAYLSQYIHDLQYTIVTNPEWDLEQIQSHMTNIQKSTKKVFSVKNLSRGSERAFLIEVSISEMLGKGKRCVRVTHATNAGIGDFDVVSE
ncbi:ATP-dependent nuclease [Stutzerimonas frequens]|uniref:AAA family ATPase n=1 Tax=Stutzerimonas frequens TaxID=2968969 RepID=A0AA47E570_9GAMM|nr:AAA family ATPase [Stutzerimonas frequens]WAE54363.1 AAA family ATPase [Stutzerimonas frequens]